MLKNELIVEGLKLLKEDIDKYKFNYKNADKKIEYIEILIKGFKSDESNRIRSPSKI